MYWKTLFFLYLVTTVSLRVVAQQDSSLNNLLEISRDSLLELKVNKSNDLEVFTSNKKLENILKTPAYVNVITSNEIQDLNFNTLDEVLEFSVGLSTTAAEGNKWPSTAIRGNTPTHYNVNTLLLFDGDPIYNPYNGSFNLAMIPLSSIERIEIVKGSNSVLYGTNAINAVINIIPKRRQRDGVTVNGRAKLGSDLTGVTNNAILFKEGDFSLNTYIDGLTTKGQEQTHLNQDTGLPFLFNKNIVNKNIASIISYKGFQTKILFTNIRDKVTENNRADQLFHFANSDTFDISVPESTDEYQVIVSSSYTHNFSENFNLTAKFQYTDWELTASTASLGRTFFSSFYRGALEGAFNFKEHTSGIIGVEYHNYFGERFRTGIRNGQSVKFLDVNPLSKSYHDIAAFINASTEISNKLNIHYGARLYTSRFGENTSQNFSPRFAVTYELKDNLVVKGIYGRSFRVPSTFEQASISNTAGGNPNLNPETSTSYDFLISGKFKFIQWDLDLFYMTIGDKIVRVDATEEARIITGIPNLVRWNENRKNFNYTGLEFNSKIFLGKSLRGFLGYAYVDVVNPENDPTILGDDPWFYNHMFNLGLSYKLNNYLNFTNSFKYLSGFGFGDNYGPLAPAYALLNLGVNIYPLKKNSLRIELKADNITDTEILRPEVSNRSINTSPTIPYPFGRRFMFGIGYKL